MSLAERAETPDVRKPSEFQHDISAHPLIAAKAQVTAHAAPRRGTCGNSERAETLTPALTSTFDRAKTPPPTGESRRNRRTHPSGDHTTTHHHMSSTHRTGRR